MFNPTWLWKNLGKFFLRNRYNAAVMIKDDGPRTGGSLIECKYIGHGNLPGCALKMHGRVGQMLREGYHLSAAFSKFVPTGRLFRRPSRTGTCRRLRFAGHGLTPYYTGRQGGNRRPVNLVFLWRQVRRGVRHISTL